MRISTCPSCGSTFNTEEALDSYKKDNTLGAHPSKMLLMHLETGFMHGLMPCLNCGYHYKIDDHTKPESEPFVYKGINRINEVCPRIEFNKE